MRISQYLELPKKMHDARTKSGMSQKYIADKMGITKQSYSRYENGVAEPSIETLEVFCKEVNMTIPELLGLSVVTNHFEKSFFEKTIAFWHSKNIQTEDELALALNGFDISFAYHSGSLENERITYHDTSEIFKHDSISSYTGDLKTLFEIINLKKAHELFLKSFQDKLSLNECLLKNFHKCLTHNIYDIRRCKLGECPGEYKHNDYVTGKNEIGASPEDVAEEIKELLEELHDVPHDKVLLAAAYFHVKFENIHPFADGNGRTGRMAMNYFLVMNGHPPITIHQEDRMEYYSALKAWDERQDLDPMHQFLMNQTCNTWKKEVLKQEISLRKLNVKKSDIVL